MYVIVVDHSSRDEDPVEPESYRVFGQPKGNCPFATFYDAWAHGDALIARPWRVARLDFSEWPADPE